MDTPKLDQKRVYRMGTHACSHACQILRGWLKFNIVYEDTSGRGYMNDGRVYGLGTTGGMVCRWLCGRSHRARVSLRSNLSRTLILSTRLGNTGERCSIFVFFSTLHTNWPCHCCCAIPFERFEAESIRIHMA